MHKLFLCRCAGEVAAVAYNDYCGVGIAYNASIGGNILAYNASIGGNILATY